jgi:hypothetical protein
VVNHVTHSMNITMCTKPAAVPACPSARHLQLQYAAFKHKAIMRDCPYCLEEISMVRWRVCSSLCQTWCSETYMQQTARDCQASSSTV